jgi:hypothetical protein
MGIKIWWRGRYHRLDVWGVVAGKIPNGARQRSVVAEKIPGLRGKTPKEQRRYHREFEGKRQKKR